MSKVSSSKSSSIVVPHRLKWHQRLVASLIYGLICCVSATLRFRWKDRSGLVIEKPQQAIFCIWHNRLALALPIYRKHVRKHGQDRQLAAIVSASKDGGIVARILEHFDTVPVRGSSSRRGPQALLEMTTWAEKGLDIAFTPDGPRGPCYEIQEGVISLARLTGLPVVPVCCYIKWKISVRSWDRFQIPLPFSRVDVEFGEPHHVPAESSDEERARLRQQLQSATMAMTKD